MRKIETNPKRKVCLVESMSGGGLGFWTLHNTDGEGGRGRGRLAPNKGGMLLTSYYK